MRKLTIILLVAMLLTGCLVDNDLPITPLPTIDTPGATQVAPTIYNSNPYMERGAGGGCVTSYFDCYGDDFGKRYYNQCHPEGYEIYEDSCNCTRTDVNHTGNEWNFMLGGRCGDIGYQFSTYIPQTCVLIEVEGAFDINDNFGLQSLTGRINVAGAVGYTELYDYAWVGNGNYKAQFYVNVGRPGTYDIAIFFSRAYPLVSTEGWAIIRSIKTMPISAGHCDNMPEI